MAYIGNKPANKALVASDIDPAVITGQTALGATPADTDEFIVSDAGVLKRMDFSHIKASPAMELLASSDASSSATITFDGNFSSTYKNYMFIYSHMVPATNQQYLGARYRVSSSDVTSSDYSQLNSRTGNTNGNSSSNDTGTTAWGSSNFQISMSTSNTASYGGASGFFYLLDPLNTSHYKVVTGQGHNFYSSTQQYRIDFSAVNRDSTDALSGITFYYGSGNIATGTIKLYGIK